MNKIHQLRKLATLDLNLLLTLYAIDQHRHITRCAQSLGVSQSAVSHALTRLRDLFGDELYVKTPRGMVPTPKAESLTEQLRPLLQTIAEVCFAQPAFSPATLTRTFNVATTDFVEQLLLPPLLKAQATAAKGMKVSFRSIGFALPQAQLEQGQIDLAIAGFFKDLPTQFYRQILFTDTFGCAVRRGHALAKRKLSLEAYCSVPHLLIAPGGELAGLVDSVLARKRLSRHIVAGTSGFLGAGFALSQSDTILTAPTRLLSAFAQYLPIDILPLPFATPPLQIIQVWHERMHGDPAHQWFRSLVHKTLSV